MNIFLDIETIPTQPEEEMKLAIASTIEAPAKMSKAETIADWHNGEGKYAGVKEAAIEEAYRKTALDGGKGQMVTACVSDGSTFCTVSRSDVVGGTHGEIEIIKDLFIHIEGLCVNHGSSIAPYFIGHNVQFDLKFLWQRAVILGVKPSFKLPFGGRHKSDFYDNMQAWAGFGQRISQDNLAKALGIPGKPDDIDGSKVWDFVKRGDVECVAEYNKYDVETVIEIYNRINFRS